MTAHEARVSDLLELPDEDRLLSADISQTVIAWSLPGLVPLQTFQEGTVSRIPLYRDAPTARSRKEDGCVIYGAGPSRPSAEPSRRSRNPRKGPLRCNMGTFMWVSP